MDHEIELKFGVPAEAVALLTRRFKAVGANRQRLEAHYFDTSEGRLGQLGIDWRLRRESDGWVQTVKVTTGAAAFRLEHNAPVSQVVVGEVPRPDPALHMGSPAGDALLRCLRKARVDLDTLEVVHGSAVWRRTLRVSAEGGQVEIALDEGELLGAGQRWPLTEVEIELLDGDATAISPVAADWVATHGLWLRNASKSDRARRLAARASAWPVVKALPHQGDMPKRASAWLRQSVRNCLEQIVANGDALASGQGHGDHVHQMRVGLRKLRTVLREVHGSEDHPALRQAFSALGLWRDQDTVMAAVAEKLEAEGAPGSTRASKPQGVADPQSVARHSDLQQALVELTLQGADLGPLAAATTGSARSLARKRLQRLHRQVVAQAKTFESLATEEQHRIRKQLKRLRYLAEFAAPSFDAKRVKRYLERLEPAQDALGAHNDNAVACEMFRTAAQAGDPGAWFAVGWLQGREPITAGDCRKTLERLAKAAPFWDA